MKLIAGLILAAASLFVGEANIISSRKIPARYVPVAVMYADAVEYPKVFSGFLDAITMWQSKVNIHIRVHTVLTLEEWLAFDGIKMNIEPLPNDPIGGQMELGYWDNSVGVLVLDADLENITSVEMDIKMASPAQAVAVHELGHAFGLPHITWVEDEKGLPVYPASEAGDLVVETQEEAEGYIMCPYLLGNDAIGISDLEADLVTRAMGLPQ
jgi:hypothetical protein